jgi:hypothetical protein
MRVEEIKILLDKYFEGETNLQDEELLNVYFNGNDVDTDLKQYQPLFQFLKVEKDILLSESATHKILDIKKDEKKLSVLRGGKVVGLWWRAAAAVMILGVSTFLINKQFNQTVKHCVADNCRVKVFDESDDPEKALAEVQAALKLVSKKMKKGTDETSHSMKKVRVITDEMDKIMPNN